MSSDVYQKIGFKDQLFPKSLKFQFYHTEPPLPNTLDVIRKRSPIHKYARDIKSRIKFYFS